MAYWPCIWRGAKHSSQGMDKESEQKITLRSCHLTYMGQLNMARWMPRYIRGLVTEYIGAVVHVQGRGHLRGPGLTVSEHVYTGRWVFHHRRYKHSAERGDTLTEPVQVQVHRRVWSKMTLGKFACPWHLCRYFIALVVKALPPHPPASRGIHKHLQQLYNGVL